LNTLSESAPAGETLERLTWFVRLRWLAVAGVLATLPGAWFLLHVRFHPVPILAVTASLAAYNVFFWRQLRRPASQARLLGLARAQIVLDLFALVVLLYFAGGVENPFSLYLVFHTAIAAIIFPGRWSLVVTTLAFGLYALMVGLHHSGVIPYFPLTGLYTVSPLQSTRSVLANLFVLGSTLYIVRYFVASLSRRLNQRTGELAEANEKLRQADRDRLQSVIMVTHELRSPMAAADSLLETVTGGYVDKSCTDCGSRPVIERARRRIKGLLKLTSDVLDLHQMELGSVRFDKVRLRLDGIVTDVVEEFNSLASAADVRVEPVGLAELPDIDGDEDSVRFILANLVSNGIRYNRAGGTVTISGRRAGNMVEVHIADTGVGIPEADLPRVFDIFYRGSYARQKERLGAGLGLSLVKQLVAAHGGSVSVTSTEGAGCDFAFSLPVATEPKAA
jgi:signal transduction histidine kinase